MVDWTLGDNCSERRDQVKVSLEGV